MLDKNTLDIVRHHLSAYPAGQHTKEIEKYLELYDEMGRRKRSLEDRIHDLERELMGVSLALREEALLEAAIVGNLFKLIVPALEDYYQLRGKNKLNEMLDETNKKTKKVYDIDPDLLARRSEQATEDLREMANTMRTIEVEDYNPASDMEKIYIPEPTDEMIEKANKAYREALGVKEENEDENVNIKLTEDELDELVEKIEKGEASVSTNDVVESEEDLKHWENKP